MLIWRSLFAVDGVDKFPKRQNLAALSISNQPHCLYSRSLKENMSRPEGALTIGIDSHEKPISVCAMIGYLVSLKMWLLRTLDGRNEKSVGRREKGCRSDSE